LFWNLRYKYLGPRFLLPDGSVTSNATNFFEMGLGYQNQRLTCGVNFINLFNSNTHDIDFGGQDVAVGPNVFPGSITFRPVEPFQARFYLTLNF
jgi:hypothetical protein